MHRFESTVLFGKYQLCRVIGRGRSGTVYLAVHLGLDEYRAIKQIPKSYENYGRLRKEALILKELKHPGIPVIYDLEEDSSYSYLIEEYLEGDSLYALVQNQGYLSKAMTIYYGIQICQLVNYLHSEGTIPILYLDLHPSNLLVCHDTIKLIDFDHAASKTEANQAVFRYGTPAFSAPEQKNFQKDLDERTDLYAIGATLLYMRTGIRSEDQETYLEEDLGRIIRCCMRMDKEERYQSVSELLQELTALKVRGTGAFKKSLSSLNIAVLGSTVNAGATHLSIGLSACLRRWGYPNLYEELNDSGTVCRLMKHFSKPLDKSGIVCVNGIMMRSRYGETVLWRPHTYRLIIQDYGAEISQLKNKNKPDAVILVCVGACWEKEEADHMQKELEQLKIPVVSVWRFMDEPYFKDPFYPDQNARKFFKKLVSKIIKTADLEQNKWKGRWSIRKYLENVVLHIREHIGELLE